MKSMDEKPTPIIISFPTRTPGDGVVSRMFALPGRGWQAVCRGINAWSPLHFWLTAAMLAVIVAVSARSAIVHKRDQELAEQLRAGLRAAEADYWALEAKFQGKKTELVEARGEIAALELLKQPLGKRVEYWRGGHVPLIGSAEILPPPPRRAVSGGAASIHRSSDNPDTFRGAPVPGR